MTQSLHLGDHPKDILACFMGHRLAVHEDTYQLPMDTLQGSKIAQLLIRIDNGSIEDVVNAKSLDEIDVHYQVEFTDRNDNGIHMSHM